MPYWEEETPQVVRTSRNVLRYYPKAQKLQVSLPDWQDENDQTRPGKTVTLDIQALVASEDKEKFTEVLKAILETLKEADEDIPF